MVGGSEFWKKWQAGQHKMVGGQILKKVVGGHLKKVDGGVEIL